jgi:hypothetical protein
MRKVIILLLILTLFGLESTAHAAQIISLKTSVENYTQAIHKNTEPNQALETYIIHPNKKLFDDFVWYSPEKDNYIKRNLEKKNEFILFMKENSQKVIENFSYLEKNAITAIALFKQNFPDFKNDKLQIIIMPSLFRFNGKTTSVTNEQYRLAIGADYLTKHPLDPIVLLSHEMGHVYHQQINTEKENNDATAMNKFASQVLTEGLTTSISKLVVPKASLETLLMDKDLATYCQEHGQELLIKVKRILNTKTNPKIDSAWFSGKPSQTNIPSRAGYCVGFLVMENLLQKYTIKDLLKANTTATKTLILEGLAK